MLTGIAATNIYLYLSEKAKVSLRRKFKLLITIKYIRSCSQFLVLLKVLKECCISLLRDVLNLSGHLIRPGLLNDNRSHLQGKMMRFFSKLLSGANYFTIV